MSKDRKIILHLGASKCATTSFQGFMRENNDRLEAQGFLWPKCVRMGYNDAGLGAYIGAARHVHRYGKHNPSAAGNVPSHIENALLKEIEESQCQTIVFSWEGLLPRRVDQIEGLMALFHKITPQVSAFAAIRRHDRWAVSSYNTRLVGHGTMIKNMLVKDRGPKGRVGAPHGIRYASAFKNWSNAVGTENVSAFAFEDYENVLDAYVAKLGFQCEAAVATIRNAGMSAYSQEILRRYNELACDEHVEARKDLDTEYSARKVRHALKALLPRGAPKLPGKAQVIEHRAHFAEDLEAMRGTFLDKSSKFFDELHEYPDTPTQVDVDDEDVLEWVSKAKALSLELEVERTRESGDKDMYLRLMDFVSRGVGEVNS